MRRTYLRNVEAAELFEDFLVSAVASILLIRVYLHLTGYPQLGSDTLHIAHMLPGGLLMLAAILLLLGYLGAGVKHVAAILGGVGFGVFIDELGKFITRENDYFFEPTAALIYLVFVVTYLAFHATRRRPLRPEESLANALEMTLEAVRHDLDREERARALELLRRAKMGDPVVEALEAALRRIEPLESSAPSLFTRWKERVEAFYGRLVERWWFVGAVVVFFAVHSGLTLAKSLWTERQLAPAIAALIVALLAGLGAVRAHRGGRRVRAAALYGLGGLALAGGIALAAASTPELSFFEWGDLVSSAIPGALVLVGIFQMPRSRLRAYRTFQRAVLFALFVTQFFAFYHAQFVAAAGLLWNLVILATLRYAIRQEERLVRRRAAPAAIGAR